jgi:hypothetical protein
MASSAYGVRSPRQQPLTVQDEETEQMQVLAALLSCLIVAEQADFASPEACTAVASHGRGAAQHA